MDDIERGEETIAELTFQLGEARQALRRKTEEAGLLRLQLDALSTTELTTGLLNRSGLVEAIETALQRSACRASPNPSPSSASASRRWHELLPLDRRKRGRRCGTSEG